MNKVINQLTIATPAAVPAIWDSIPGWEGAALAGTCGLTGAGGARLGAVLMGRDAPPIPLLGGLGLEEPKPNPPPPRLLGIP